jgi:hypothetical protein
MLLKIVMSDSSKSFGRILYFAQVTIHLTLTAVIFSWPSRGPWVLTIPTLLNADTASGFLLLFTSLFCLKHFGRLAVYGLIINIVTLAILLLPTV